MAWTQDFTTMGNSGAPLSSWTQLAGGGGMGLGVVSNRGVVVDSSGAYIPWYYTFSKYNTALAVTSEQTMTLEAELADTSSVVSVGFQLSADGSTYHVVNFIGNGTWNTAYALGGDGPSGSWTVPGFNTPITFSADITSTPSKTVTVRVNGTALVTAGGYTTDTAAGRYFGMQVSNGAKALRWEGGDTGGHVPGSQALAGTAIGVSTTSAAMSGGHASAGPPSTNMLGWWDASDAASMTVSAGRVSQWRDKSGAGRHFAQANGSAQPALASGVLAGMSVVKFDGGRVLEIPGSGSSNIITGTTCSFFVVYRSVGVQTDTYARVLSFRQFGSYDWDNVASFALCRDPDHSPNRYPAITRASNIRAAYNGEIRDTWIIVSGVFDGSTCDLFVNGVSTGAVASTGTFDVDVIAFATDGYPGSDSVLDVAEVIVYSDAKVGSARTDIETYLGRWFAVGPAKALAGQIDGGATTTARLGRGIPLSAPVSTVAGTSTTTADLTKVGVGSALPIAGLQDTFDTTVDKATKWPQSSAAVVWDATGRAKIPCTTSFWKLASATGTWKIDNSTVTARVTPPQVGTGTRDTRMTVAEDSAANNSVSFRVVGSTFRAYKTLGGVDTALGSPVTYDPLVHVWWRISGTASSTTHQWSTNGLAWNTMSAHAVVWDVSKSVVQFSSGYTGTEAPDDAYVDNVNSPVTALVGRADSTSTTTALLGRGILLSAAGSVLSDEFPGTSIDASQWTVYNRLGDQFNHEVNAVIPANVRVGSGTLFIDAKHEDAVAGDSTTGPPNPRTVNYTSGQIAQKAPSFLYGDVQVRAKIPGGIGLWPCIWMLGTAWQASQPFTADIPGQDWPNGPWWELDIAEFMYGHRSVVNNALHFISASRAGSGEKALPFDATTRFMVYRLVWTATTLTWMVDAEDGVGWRTLTAMTGTPGVDIPNTAGYLVIHIAIGGDIGGTPDPATFPQTMEVDYARVTAAAGGGATGVGSTLADLTKSNATSAKALVGRADGVSNVNPAQLNRNLLALAGGAPGVSTTTADLTKVGATIKVLIGTADGISNVNPAKSTRSPLALNGTAAGEAAVSFAVLGGGQTRLMAGASFGVATATVITITIADLAVWTGALFQPEQAATWNGSAWVDAADILTWNGLAWV